MELRGKQKTLASLITMSNQGTSLPKSSRRVPVEDLSDDGVSLISEVSEDVSIVTEKSYQDRSHSRPIQGRSTNPKATVPLAVKEPHPITGGRSRLIRSDTFGHDTEPVNFSKDIFDTYSTTFPFESVEAKYTKYQQERLMETEKDDRPDFQRPPISILSTGGNRQPELENDHYLSLAIFCYKYWR